MRATIVRVCRNSYLAAFVMRGIMTTLPGPTVGVIGGGQLGRMLGEAAAPLGVDLIVLDPTESPPARATTTGQIAGGFGDREAVMELASQVDALTYEIELADPDLLAEAAKKFDIPVHPDPATLRTIQDKLIQTEALADAGIPIPEFVGVDTEESLSEAVEELRAVMLKARTGGYDGRGNIPVDSPADAADALRTVGGNALAEAFVPYEREVSVIGVKGADTVRTYPVTETIHREQILRESLTPARASPAVRDKAQSVAVDVLETLEGRGVYGIELFETAAGQILVNEIAPRPHNSGHWTIEGAVTSQFENHLRAVLGWPLGPTDLVAPTATANLLGDTPDRQSQVQTNPVDTVLADSETSLHWYGKREVYPLRKMGHITVTDRQADAGGRDTSMDPLEKARELRDQVTFTAE
ncbi:MAG: 5-(carboxyamino)imidazole ribonucleotide synthase [uncultured archaeon A07HR60]|nr:MAG: 5-(carboxyamino)imidazole ribonucleotide synthase [uncultured archaeon A07HR60]